MDPGILIALIVLVLALIAAGLSWRTPASYLCIVIALIEMITLLPGGPW